MNTFKRKPRLSQISSLCAVMFMLLPSLLQAQETTKITYILPSGSTYKLVDRNIKELYIFQTEAVSIQGLSNLPYLEKVTFEIPAHLKDFSFLDDCPNLKVLHLMDCSPQNLDFLYRQHELAELVMQSCKLGSEFINISQIPSLDYLEISNSGLEQVPITVSNIKSSHQLTCINLAYNMISKLSSTERQILDVAKYVIIEGNSVQVNDQKYLKGDLFSILPQAYRKYIR